MTNVAAMPAQNSPCASENTQNQNGARTRPDTDGENRAETTPPAAWTGQLRGLGTIGMPAMLVMDMDMVMIMMLRMRMSGHMLVNDGCVRGGMVVMMSPRPP